jgi:hypothetical protein
MNLSVQILRVVTMLACCIAVLPLLVSLTAKTGDEEIACAVQALAIAIIPYVLTQCLEGLLRTGEERAIKKSSDTHK